MSDARNRALRDGFFQNLDLYQSVIKKSHEHRLTFQNRLVLATDHESILYYHAHFDRNG